MTFSALVGQSQFDDLDNETHIQLGAGWRFPGPWEIEGVYASVDSSGGAPEIDVDVTRWHLDAKYNIRGADGQPLRVYVLGGIGYASTDFEGGFDNDDRLLNLGAGVKYDLGSGWALRAEARLFDVEDIDELQSVFNIGLQYTIHPSAASK